MSGSIGGFVEAQLATLLDMEGKEIDRQTVTQGETPPVAPDGRQGQASAAVAHLPNEAFGYT
jgi:type I restriction enzyme M protein